jgi:alpha-tubulin suppressor-like RCC1 family protein
VSQNFSSEIVEVEATRTATLLLTKNGEVYRAGVLFPDGDELNPGFRKIDGLENVRTMTAGAYHALFITNHKLLAYGSNTRGQLGIGNTKPTNVAVTVELPLRQNEKPVKIACGLYHSLVLTSEGRLYFFGAETPSGTGSMLPMYSPRIVDTIPEGEKIVLIEAGPRSAHLYTDHNNMYSYGLNNYQSLGFSDNTIRLVPEPVEDQFLHNKVIRSLSCARTCLAITSMNHHFSLSSR